MVYKLYVEAVKSGNKIGWSYSFYNHQDFMVYKRFGLSEEKSEEQVILETSLAALTYFERSIRRRYYDEHFSTRIDEDYVTLYTNYADIKKAAEKCKAVGNMDFAGDYKEIYIGLMPFFTQKTITVKAPEHPHLTALAKELAQKGLN